MTTLSPSLFIREPGKTKTISLETGELEKSAKKLRRGEILEIEIRDAFLLLKDKNLSLIARLKDERLSQKIRFLESQKARFFAIFISFQKPTAQFLIKSELPIFADEKTELELKPYARIKDLEEDEVGSHILDGDEEVVEEEEKNPLTGLKIIDKEERTEDPE